MMNLYFDFDGENSVEVVQKFVAELRKNVHIKIQCLTTRVEADSDEVFKVADALEIAAIPIGRAIDDGTFSCKADFIAMQKRFAVEGDSFILFDNDPNEICEALKRGILAFLVPSYLTEGLFEGIDFDVIMR